MVRAFLRAPSGVIGLVIIALLVIDAIVAPRVLSGQAENIDITAQNQGPSWNHLLGTDQLGRDLLARTLVAAELSLKIALGAAALAFVLGIAIGVTTAVVGRRTRPVIQRLIDTMIAFPALIVVIFISTIVGRGVPGALIGVGIAGSFGFARFVSTQALAVGGQDFVAAARVLGVSRRRLMYRYVVPNIAEPLIISLSFILTFGLLAVAGLSFVGLGVQPPDYDWGGLLTDGVKVIYSTPQAALVPAGALAITALAFGFFGEALARSTNPLLWTLSKEEQRQLDTPADESEERPAGADAAPAVGAWRRNGASAPPTGEAALEVEDLVVSFPGRERPVEVVKGVSFSVPVGGVLGIVGESGSGKTMTMLSIGGLVPYPGRVTGRVSLHGHDLAVLPGTARRRLLAKELAYVFQDPMSSLNPALTVGRHLTERAEKLPGMARRPARALAAARLREVHLPVPELQLRRYPHQLSGGMRQRVLIAMGLTTEPSLLICDEPTTALDVTIQAQIMDVLAEVNSGHRETAIVLISHNLALVAQNCHRILVMYAGRIVEDLDQRELLTDPRHPYTRALLGALPTIGRSRDEPLTYIPGEIPDLAAPPPGCPFHPRCPLAVDRCRAERPPLVAREGGRRVACWVAANGSPAT
jgi:oligopeptide/dipeptide ABC transporter ATP-binding protein